jgi:hypothetical protein
LLLLLLVLGGCVASSAAAPGAAGGGTQVFIQLQLLQAAAHTHLGPRGGGCGQGVVRVSHWV